MRNIVISILTLGACACTPDGEVAGGDAAAVAAPTASATSLALTSGSITAGDIRLSEGASFEGVATADGLVLGPFVSLYSTQQIPVSPGDVIEWQYAARSISDPTNGEPNNFFIGPVGVDASGAVVQWWEEQAPIYQSEGVRTGGGSWVVGENVTLVGIGMNGNWSEAAPAGDGVIGVQSVQIAKAIP